MNLDRFLKRQFPNNCEDHADPNVPENFYFHFKNNVCRIYQRWDVSLRERTRSFDRNGVTSWLVCFRIRGKLMHLYEFGYALRKGRAKDIAAFKLYRILTEKFSEFIMPPYLVGFPNVRGHCYLISAVLTLLHSPPVLMNLLEIYGEMSRLRNAGLLAVNPRRRQAVEPPYYWTNLFFELFIAYNKVSSRKQLSLENTGILYDRVMEGISDEAYSDSRDDVDLDRKLISGLCSSLRDYSSVVYGTPGGMEGAAYFDVMNKLAGEDISWKEQFFWHLRVVFNCEDCGEEKEHTFMYAILNVWNGVSFEDMLDNPRKFLLLEKPDCPDCNRSILFIDSVQIINTPKILCFNVPKYKYFDPVPIPEKLSLSTVSGHADYILSTYSNSINCFEGFSHFYHVPGPKDVSIGGHSYITMKTKLGYFEMNNGYLYICDQRILLKTTAGGIYFYQRAEFSNILATINPEHLQSNPEL